MTRQINPNAVMARLRLLIAELEQDLGGRVTVLVVLHRDGGRVTFEAGEPLDSNRDPS